MGFGNKKDYEIFDEFYKQLHHTLRGPDNLRIMDTKLAGRFYIGNNEIIKKS